MGKPNNNDDGKIKEKGNKNFWSEFLDLYEAKSVLWDIKHKGYNNQKLRNSASVILANKLKEIYPRADTIMVQQRINSFLTSYQQQKLKVDGSKHLGASADEVYKHTLWFYNKLSFLDGSNNALTVSTTPLNTINDDDCNEDYEPAKKKQKKLSDSDEFITLAKEMISKQSTCNDSNAKYWSKACNDMDNDQRIIAVQEISNIIYKGQNRMLMKLPDENKITHSAAKLWMQTCNNMSNDQRKIAQLLITGILFKGENGMLNFPTFEKVTVFRGN